MKRNPILFLSLLLFSSLLHAAPSTTVGVLDTARVLQESKRANARASDLNAWRKTNEQSISAKLAEINKNRQRLLSPNIDDTSRDALQNEVREEEAALQQQVEEMQQELFKRRQVLLSGIIKELRPIIETVAKREGIELLLDAASNRGILFVDKGIDLTDEVIKLYDNQR